MRLSLLLPALVVFPLIASAQEAVQYDIRGLKTGMSQSEAQQKLVAIAKDIPQSNVTNTGAKTTFTSAAETISVYAAAGKIYAVERNADDSNPAFTGGYWTDLGPMVLTKYGFDPVQKTDKEQNKAVRSLSWVYQDGVAVTEPARIETCAVTSLADAKPIDGCGQSLVAQVVTVESTKLKGQDELKSLSFLLYDHALAAAAAH